MRANYLILIAIFLISCNQEYNSPNKENDKHQQSTKLAKAWLDAFAYNDLKNLDLIMSPDATVYGFGGIDSMSFDGVLDKMQESADRKNHSPFTNEQWLPIQNNAIFNGEGILFWGTSNLNYKNGSQASVPVHIVILIENDKIKKMHFYYDLLNIRKDIEKSISVTEDN